MPNLRNAYFTYLYQLNIPLTPVNFEMARATCYYNSNLPGLSLQGFLEVLSLFQILERPDVAMSLNFSTLYSYSTLPRLFNAIRIVLLSQ